MMNRSPARLAPMGIALALALAACDAPVGPDLDDAPVTAVDAHRGYDDGVIAKPFRADFVTRGQGPVPDPACGDFPRLLNTQVGEGQATHLGRFSFVATFCMDVTDVLDDGQLTAGESVPYDNGFGILTAANGDELHIEISGAVLPSDHPDYDFEFRDEFRFTDGTGRFAGVTGEGMTDSFVVQSEDRTDHQWIGTLVTPLK